MIVSTKHHEKYKIKYLVFLWLNIAYKVRIIRPQKYVEARHRIEKKGIFVKLTLAAPPYPPKVSPKRKSRTLSYKEKSGSLFIPIYFPESFVK